MGAVALSIVLAERDGSEESVDDRGRKKSRTPDHDAVMLRKPHEPCPSPNSSPC